MGAVAVSTWIGVLSKKVSDKFMKLRNKNRPSPLPGQMSYEATKPGFSYFVYLRCTTCLLIGEYMFLLCSV